MNFKKTLSLLYIASVVTACEGATHTNFNPTVRKDFGINVKDSKIVFNDKLTGLKSAPRKTNYILPEYEALTLSNLLTITDESATGGNLISIAPNA